MSRVYPGEDFDDAADRIADESVQREIDDGAEAKRAASGMSPEQLSMQDAFIEGARAGRMGFGASLNPYQDSAPEHNEWNRGRLSAIGQAHSRRAA
jgi:hypothetical protein